MPSHEFFDELCALSAMQQLTPDEQATLETHLTECAGCTERLQQYKGLALSAQLQGLRYRAGLSTASDGYIAEDVNQATKASLLQRVQAIDIERQRDSATHQNFFAFLRGSTPSRVAWTVAASLLLVTALAIFDLHPSRPNLAVSGTTVLSEPDGQVQQLDTVRRELAQERNQREVLAESQARTQGELEQLRADRTHLFARIESAEASTQRLSAEAKASQDKLRALQSSLDTVQAANIRLQTENGDLSQKAQKAIGLEGELRQARSELAVVAARGQEAEHQSLSQVRYVEQQRKLLATDHDLRDILGARSLRIIDVYDVSAKGQYEQPFGRIFYAEGKYLIFYAFDLDRQKGLKAGTTFQAWGQKDSAKEAPRSLGAFYMDNPRENRWVLKVDDTKLLSRIDYVFVTDSSHQDATRPRGRLLLSASLNGDVNHP